MASIAQHNLRLIDSVSDVFKWTRYKKLLARIDRHELFSLSGSFAYTTALSLSPFVIITISLLSLANLGTQETLVTQIQSLAGKEAGEVISGLTEAAQEQSSISGVSGIVGFLVLLISASAVFSQLRIAFDKINEYRPPKRESGVYAFFREKVFSVGLVLGFIFLLIVSLGLSTALAAMLPAGDGLLLKVAIFAVNFCVFWLVFATMFRFIPSQRMDWERCWISGFAATIFFLAGKALIGLYIGHSALASAYGAAGSLIVFLVWIYYTSLTLLLSFEFTNTVLLERENQKEKQ